jgi:hypothetical protein
MNHLPDQTRAGRAQQLSGSQPSSIKGDSIVRTSARKLGAIRSIAVVLGLCAGASPYAHADSVSASVGKSIPFTDDRCFSVFWGAVQNNGACGSGAKKWEMQLPVRASGKWGINLYTSFSGGSCQAFTTDQYGNVRSFVEEPTVIPEGSSFRRFFAGLDIATGGTMSVQCLVPASSTVKTVSWFIM